MTSETMPAALTPRRLTRTTDQIAPTVNTTAIVRFCRAGYTFITAPANATAITGNDAQIEIQ